MLGLLVISKEGDTLRGGGLASSIIPSSVVTRLRAGVSRIRVSVPVQQQGTPMPSSSPSTASPDCARRPTYHRGHLHVPPHAVHSQGTSRLGYHPFHTKLGINRSAVHCGPGNNNDTAFPYLSRHTVLLLYISVPLFTYYAHDNRYRTKFRIRRLGFHSGSWLLR